MSAWFYENKTPPQKSPYRFSIGAILFRRSLWEEMLGFEVGAEGEMGNDEIYICNYCGEQFLAIYVDTNILAGHLSYGRQTEDMIEYLKNHYREFDIN